MKTEVMMQRHLTDGIVVRQSNLTTMLNVTDLMKGFNDLRVSQGLNVKELKEYWKNESTQEYMDALVKELDSNRGNSTHLVSTRRGNNGGTWVHPYIFMDIAMWLNPEFKAKVMIWATDNLLGLRNGSGDSYMEMTKSLVNKFPNKAHPFMIINMGKRIFKHVLGNAEDWQCATPEQLKERDKLHARIINACELLLDSISYDEFSTRVFKR